MADYKDKIVVITGGSDGIGKALVAQFLALGAKVATCGRTQTKLDDLAREFNSPNLLVIAADVSQQSDCTSFIEKVVSQWGTIDILINNAGISMRALVKEVSIDTLKNVMDINFWGVVYGSKALLPHMQKVEEAHIVNTSSIFGTIAVPSQSAYNASKFAVRGFTYALRMELEKTHINVSCVQPGGVKTNIVRDSRYIAPDNAAPTKEEITATFESMANLTSDQAAEKILTGVIKNKAQILVGRDAIFIAILERLAPVLYQKLISRAFS